MIHINPYKRNCEVIKKFFSKPITLIISVILFISAVTSVSVGIVSNNISSMPLGELLSAIGFLVFYIKGKSKRDNISFNAPANILIISNIIYMVVNIVALAFSALFLILNSFGFNLLENTASYLSIGNLDFVFTSLLNSFVIYSPIYLLNILAAIAMLVLLGSVKKSSRSIYLYKRGSIFLELVSFALASTHIAIIVYNGISISTVAPAVQVIISIVFGFFSMMYYRFINNISNNVFVPQPTIETIDTTVESTTAPVTEPVQEIVFKDSLEVAPITKIKLKPSKDDNYGNALVGMWEDAEVPVTERIVSTPQVTDTKSDSDYNYPHSPILAMDEIIPIQHNIDFKSPPMLIHEEPPIEQVIESVCPVCGTSCPPKYMFCGNCGNKLNK